MNNRELYEYVGHLFYAIASADGMVRKEEEEKLAREFNKIWVKFNSEGEADVAYYLFVAFDYLKERNTLPEHAYQAFETWYLSARSQVNQEMKQAIQFTAAAIALSFNGYNKAELHYLSRLNLLLMA